jgi:tetratricopeptide (TPR) repeat protein
LAFQAFLIVLVSLSGCSSESNSWSSKAFHNTTAHYNGYYYAQDEIRKIEGTIRSNLKDDYNRILRLFPGLDSIQALSYDDQIQEVIKMASLAIQRHPNSKWVDDSYILVGKARLYSLDWGNAIQTFKYVNTKSKEPNARHQALIYLARTFTEHGEYNNAEATFSYLEKEKLTKTNLKGLYLEKAYYYQIRGDYDKMVRNLTDAVPLLTRKDRPGRIYFIIGQVYQKLGFEAEAYNYFRECLQTHPEYEVDFYARLYMAQVAEISKSRNIANARKSFKKLLKDTKNKDFKDKIYYEMGLFEYKQKNLSEAIANYNRAIREGANKSIDGEAYLRLGEIYYDTLRKFELAKAYYDSAIASLSQDYENYSAIKNRQEILSDFVTQLQTIKWQDSLIVLAQLDSTALMTLIQDDYDKKKAAEPKPDKKKKRARIDIDQVNTGINVGSSFGGTDWYFGNSSAVVIGQQEFKRIWGNIPLEDNWRRSSRAMPPANRPATIAGGDLRATEVTGQITEEVKSDPVTEEFNRINAQLPKTPEQLATALGLIEDAYFNLGDIYYFKLEERENAVNAYIQMLNRFPETHYRPEVLYKLYLMLKDDDVNQSEKYAQELIATFPESSFAKVLINPDYLVESSIALEKQQQLYKEAYSKFEHLQYREALDLLEEAFSLEKTTFYPNLQLLKILITGKTAPLAQYQFDLEQFIDLYPDNELTVYAKKLLMTSMEYELKLEKQSGARYRTDSQAPHYFILMHRSETNLTGTITGILNQFNESQFKPGKLSVSNLIFNDEYAVTMVSEFSGQMKAMEYYRAFTEKQQTNAELKNHKFNIFVITKDNFDIFYRIQGLDEYKQFFEKYYRTENP